MTNEAGGLTIASHAKGADLRGGLLYSQYYNVIKAPFDAQKIYALHHPIYENLALDPTYVLQLRRAAGGGASVADLHAMRKAYIRGKNRAALNLRECEGKSFGTREEHRISLALFREIRRQWAATEPAIRQHRTLPAFLVPTVDVMNFLGAQINRHCFLFEYILGRTAAMFTLKETVPMIIALRGLRHCYGSSRLYEEPVLFGDRWVQEVPPDHPDDEENEAFDAEAPNGRRVRAREYLGLGMRRSMEEHGFAWWMTNRFDWALWRFKPEPMKKLLAGNLLLRTEYRRRYNAIKGVHNMHSWMFTFGELFREHALGNEHRRKALDLWLDVAHCYVIRLFDLAIWDVVHDRQGKENGRELLEPALRDFPRGKPPPFTFDAMFPLFYSRHTNSNNQPCGPYLVRGGKQKKSDPREIIKFLFEWRDTFSRKGWATLDYRVATQKLYAIIHGTCGAERADAWFRQLLDGVLLTHWILPSPHPSSTKLTSFTKQSAHRDLVSRFMWFSTVAWPKGLRVCREGWPDAKAIEAREGVVSFIKHGRAAKIDFTIALENNLERRIKKYEPKRRWKHSDEDGVPLWRVADLSAAAQELKAKVDFMMGKANHEPFIPIVERGNAPKLEYYQDVSNRTDPYELMAWFEEEIRKIPNLRGPEYHRFNQPHP